MGVFSYASYSTTYSVRSGDFSIHNENAACFSEMFRSIRNIRNDKPAHYEIFINKDPEYVAKRNRNNYCFLNKHELYNHVNILKQVMNVKFKIKEFDDHFLVVADVLGSGCTQKYFVSWIRYAYEYPYNALCLDVNALRQTPGFQFISKVNIFSLLSRCGPDFPSCHSIVYSGMTFDLKSNDHIRNKLIQNPDRVTSVLSGDHYSTLEPIHESEINTLDRNAIEASFKNRVSIYKSILSEYESLRSRPR